MKKIIAVFIIISILIDLFVSVNATIENNENIIYDEEDIGDEALDTDIYGDYEKNIEDKLKLEVNDNLSLKSKVNKGFSLKSASGFGVRAGNETEFRDAFYNTSVTELTTSTNIRLNSTYTVNHNLRINTSSSIGNALQLSPGCQIIVPKDCILTLDSMVIDGRQFGNDDRKACIIIQNGGTLMLTDHSIIDGGTKNWGIQVENGGNLLVESCQISYCDRGIVLKGNSYCSFGNNEAVSMWGNTGKPIDITYNNIGIYCGGIYSGTLIVDNTANTTEKTNFENNKEGMYIELNTGSITVVHARMVYNDCAIHTYGNITINDINAAFNACGIENEGGTVNFRNGSFYSDSSNQKEYGIYNKLGTVNIQAGLIHDFNVGIQNLGTLNISNGDIQINKIGIENNGILNFTGGNIITNIDYDIKHRKNNNDTYGGLRIERADTVSSKIYLLGSDSYIYTGSKIPIFSSITLENISLERPIIRTSSTTFATAMISKINVTNKENYEYKANPTGHLNYVVLWLEPNVAIVNYEDLLSGVASALYWYNSISNSFTGAGTNFENGKIFEDYGYYKIVVTDKLGLRKTINFNLNQNSI